ncbi:MAG: DUF4469 domain-containing protein [Prevotellaceae bacterium]|jgi:hypothetical protein|nr:DUF4469 domain-containing protein [Prevotellaceae bacterium]
MDSNHKYEVYVQLQNNPLTPDDDTDLIAKPLPSESADREAILTDVMNKNPGLEPETLGMIYDLLMRSMEEMLLTGKRLKTKLFSAALAYSGTVNDGVWDYHRNKVRINFTQSRELNSLCNNRVHVNITSQRSQPIRITGVNSAATRTDARNTVTAGKPAVFTGKNIQVEGTDPAVGVTLRNVQTGTVTTVEPDMFSQNTKSKLAFVIPADLPDGEYELKVTTQYNGNIPLKTPRSALQTVYIGEMPPASADGDNR